MKENHHFVIILHIQQKTKTLSPYSEDYQNIKIPKKEIFYEFLSIAILHSVNTQDDKYYPQVYMKEYKYERTEEVSHFENDSDSDSDSDSHIE